MRAEVDRACRICGRPVRGHTLRQLQLCALPSWDYREHPEYPRLLNPEHRRAYLVGHLEVRS